MSKMLEKHAKAIIVFLKPEEGGRVDPVRSGYRGQFHYDDHDWDATQIYDTDDWVYPGETITAWLIFVSPDSHRGKLYPGKKFEIREGRQVVAKGKIVEVYLTN